MIQPAGTLSIKDILYIKDEVKITNLRFPVMKFICNTKGAALCLPFLIGGHCDSTDPCGYHLQVNDPDRFYGTPNVDYAPFHYWLASRKEYVCISTASSQNAKLDISSSS